MQSDTVSITGDRFDGPASDAERLCAEGLVEVDEACAFLAIRKQFAYELMKRGELPCVKIGARRVVPRRALVEFAASRLSRRDDA